MASDETWPLAERSEPKRWLPPHVIAVCATATAGAKVEVHHIVPVAKGGPDTADNAIALCFFKR